MEDCLDRMELCRGKCPEWTVATKCCFCVPIRKGVTIFGYVNLKQYLPSHIFPDTMPVSNYTKMQPLRKKRRIPKNPLDTNINNMYHIMLLRFLLQVLALLSFPVLVFLMVEQMTAEKAQNEAEFQVLLEPSVHLPLTIAFVLIDVMMTVLLLIGAHKKKKILLQIYFHFGVVFQLVTLCTDLVYFDFQEYIENAIYFLFLGLNVYLLFLVFNTVRLLKESSDVQYVAYRDLRR